MKVTSQVPDLAHKHDIWDGYMFFWRDRGDEGGGLPPLKIAAGMYGALAWMTSWLRTVRIKGLLRMTCWWITDQLLMIKVVIKLATQ